MPGYPNLFPSGFVEYEKDSCSGPILYRSQPSRETPGIVELNQVMEKYGNGQYKGGDLLALMNNLKSIQRSWERLPLVAKKDFLKLIIESNTSLSDSIIKKYVNKSEPKIEHFGEDSKNDNRSSILIIIVIAIVSIVIGYLIAYVSH